jgi:beta-aspartyl-peptidase (threonine type)
MKPSLTGRVALLVALVASMVLPVPACGGGDDIAIVVHGGAGGIRKDSMTPEREAAYREKLTEALEVGYKILEAGGSSLDAVEATIRVLEDSPLFNAGKGSVFTNLGRNEMDASIMDGKTLDAGAVASVTRIKNPITAARAVMTGTRHVLLVGAGAETFAREHGLEMADSAYFWTQERWDELQRVKQEQESRSKQGAGGHGTVGCVAIDKDGNIAAGTSTGGLTNKLWGRVGDSPVIGAGTYADNRTCGVSCTGVGEYFMRALIAYDLTARMRYFGVGLEEASGKVLETLTTMGGEGGFIALDRKGNIEMPFNTSGMYRGFIRGDGVSHVFLFRDE